MPSNETPPIVLAFCKAVAVPAFPEALPVTLPVSGPENDVAVAIPVITIPVLVVSNF